MAVVGSRGEETLGIYKGDLHSSAREAVGHIPENLNRLEELFQTFKPHRYYGVLQDVYNQNQRVLKVYMDDLEEFLGEYVFGEIRRNTLRYVELLYEAAEGVIRDPEFKAKALRKTVLSDGEELARLTAQHEGKEDDLQHARHNLLSRRSMRTFETLRERGMRSAGVPAHLRCEYEIQLVPSDRAVPIRVRAGLLAENVGSFVSMEADVVCASPVHPRLRVAGFRCKLCGDLAYQPVCGSSFFPLMDCPRSNCKKTESGSLHLYPRICRIVRKQDIRVQEPAHQVPQGDAPYMVNCLVTGDLSSCLIPGSTVTMSGVLRSVQKTGFSSQKSGADTLFEVLHFVENKVRTFDTAEETERVELEVKKLLKCAQNNLFDRLAYNIAPEIHGLENVKKALLLQMIGGVSKTKSDGGKIRGDIHVLLMGDPGVAKSQLMKSMCQIIKRAVYATGMGSSGVGLTAALVKDPVTGESALQGGALVLADQGLCCLDEFDKMDEYDRSAIYEVMEQQSVSIAKAGHCNTLPARCSLLAAANPAHGRYDLSKSVLANMDMPAALLTRFDLQFLLLDTPDKAKDTRMADHILNVIRGKVKEFQLFEPIDPKVYRALIEKCKDGAPTVPPELASEIADHYVEMRQIEAQQESGSADDRTSYTTLRTVLAIMRVCQALAKLRFAKVVQQEDFYEARRLIDASKLSIDGAESKKRADPNAQVFELIRRLWKVHVARYGRRNSEGLPLAEIERQALIQGFKKMTLDGVIEMYVENTAFCLNENKTHLVVTNEVQDSSADEDEDF